MANEKNEWGSNISFLLAMIGSAVGLGNIWRFPYVLYSNGGGAFMLPYFAALIILGLPLMLSEWNLGRYGGKYGHGTLGPMVYLQAREGAKPKTALILGAIAGGLAFAVTLLVNSYYNHLIGWTLGFAVSSFTGAYMDQSQSTADFFVGYIQDPKMVFTFWIIALLGLSFAVMRGVEKGIEAWAKVMMPVLYVFGIVLAIRSLTIGSPVNPEWSSLKGLNFIWNPDFSTLTWRSALAAAGQIFFTLSIGIGAMLIFGSYMEKDQRLFGEAVNITVLDTVVALMAGFIIIPACFAYGIEPGAGPSLIFITIPNIFAQVAGGRVWGGLFFLFLSFAAFTTLVAVFENIISFDMDLFGWSRKKSTLVSLILIIILSMPCVMGFNVLAGFTPLGEGSTIMDLEDFIVSNNLLPLGSLGYVLFCTKKNGWGWNSFLEEINQGEGWKFPAGIKGYMSYGLPLLIIIIYLKGYYDKFQPMGTKTLIG